MVHKEDIYNPWRGYISTFEMRLIMKATLTNVYTNESPENRNLKGAHGQAFYISIGSENILFDTGGSSEVLLHNMNELGLEPQSITKIFLSHGHYDHTYGLPGLLDSIDPVNPIPVFGHPSITEEKVFKMAIIKKNIGFPNLSEEQQNKIEYHLTRDPVILAEGLTSTGEISNRPYRDGSEPNAYHEVGKTLEVDPVFDDQSVVLDTEEGLVLIAGCCHAGLLNTLEHVEKMRKKSFKAIIGGTHMVRYSKKEVEEVADILEGKYNLPDLYLNHCTDNFPLPLVRKTPVTKILKQKFGRAKVKTCAVGTELVFEVPEDR
jgi:7,8-dihydropterin-6-yl-methyl-4-(beta-D-ribofuranosyl)aminobenzene 5'-phosphate synthase